MGKNQPRGRDVAQRPIHLDGPLLWAFVVIDHMAFDRVATAPILLVLAVAVHSASASGLCAFDLGDGFGQELVHRLADLDLGYGEALGIEVGFDLAQDILVAFFL